MCQGDQTVSRFSARSCTAWLGIAVMVSLLGACGPSNTGTTVSPGEMQRAGTIGGGRIIGVQDVGVAGTTSGIGTIGGGVAGAVVGSSVAHGRMGVLAGVAGAIGGALLGNAIERSATSGSGTQFVVQRDDGQTMTVVQTNEQNLQTGDRVVIVDQGGKTRLMREGTGGMPDAPPPAKG